jgi:hypothetical protein
MPDLQEESPGGGMNRLTQVIGVAFILVAVFSAVTLAMTLDRYNAVSEARIKLSGQSGNMWISEVQIPRISGTDSPVTLTVLIEVNNPTRVDIWIYNVEFTLWMFNESNLDRMNNPQVLGESYVGIGGFNKFDFPVDFIPSGGNGTVMANLTVRHPDRIEVLNTTDPEGKYNPLVTADLRYLIEIVDDRVTVRGLSYFNPLGVDPYEG